MKLYRFSKTQINMFVEDCGMRWYFRYGLNIKTPPSGAMKVGLGYHEAAAFNYKQKVKSEKDLSAKDLSDVFAKAWKEGLQREEVVFEEGDTKEKMLDQGVGLVKAFQRDIAGHVMPASEKNVEESLHLLMFKRPVEGERPQIRMLPSDWRDAGNVADDILAKESDVEWAYILDAIIDITDWNGVIRENKTGSKTPTQADADKLLDLHTYALAHRLIYREAEKGVALDMAVKLKNPTGVIVPSKRSVESLRAHLDRVGLMAKAIENGIFIPHTNWWGCSERFCGYWARCPFGGKSVVRVDMGANLEQNLKDSIQQAEQK